MSVKKLFFRKKNLIGAKEDGSGGVLVSGILNERHNVSAEISTNAIENGEGITFSDHIHIKPIELSITVIVTNNVVDLIANNRTNHRNKYQELLDLMSERGVFDIQTGLKLYKNFALKSISTAQDVDSANILEARLELQEVIIASSEVIDVEIQPKESTDVSVTERGEK